MSRKPSPWEAAREDTGETQRDRDMDEAIRLIEQALYQLREADFDSALWRLVDAAGLTTRYAGFFAMGKEVEPTGRGYYLGTTP